jgi:hypothetical protein
MALDDPDSRRDLHRPRDQRLSASRVARWHCGAMAVAFCRPRVTSFSSCREQVTEYLNRARLEPDGDAQRRFVDIAQHYRILAEAEASNASRMGDERRARRHDAK